MTDSTISTEPGIDATAFALVTGAQAEQALRSAIQRLERLGDSSLDLAHALVKLGALRQERGGHSEAEELFRRALDISERTLGSDHIELVHTLTSLGSARILSGSPETAEPLFNRALSISTRYLGEDHPDLVIMVNDVARLYLKHGAYLFAEPLLQRLLSMKRSKGDDHPEVATVLASLAAVRQARGQHESAEELWRRVLAIRERTLAPNHFAQATALEHLAGVCTARGKFGEALQLFQRAQMIREMTLGSDHSSLRILRERIADLQLQASEDSFEVPSISTPGTRPDDLRSADNLGINTPVARRQTRETRRRTRIESPMPVVERDLPRPLVTNDEDAPPAARVASTDDAEEREAAAFAYRAALLEERQNADETDEGEPIGLVRGVFASAIALVRKHKGEVLAVAGVMAFLLIAVAASTRASSEIEPTIVEPPSGATMALPVVVPQPLTGQKDHPQPLTETKDHPQPLTGTKDQLNVPAPTSANPTRIITPPRARAIEQRNPDRASERRAEPTRISIPTIFVPMTNRVDSLVRAASAPAGILRESFPAPPALSPTNTRPGFGDPESGTPLASRARLIGSLPTPLYPSQRTDLDGEVLVQFSVDTAGYPEMSTFSVVNSPNALLTAAVRKVIQDLRFEPARTPGPEFKPIGDRVQIRYLFRR